MEYRVGRALVPVEEERPNMSRSLEPDPYEADTFNNRAAARDRFFDNPITREEFDALTEQVYRLNKTLEGIQQLFVRAGEYQGKPRGRLTR